MGNDKELNKLSLDELEMVAGGNDVPEPWNKSLVCNVQVKYGPQYQGHSAVIVGYVPLRIGAIINVPALEVSGQISAIEPGNSNDNHIEIRIELPVEIPGKSLKTEVYTL